MKHMAAIAFKTKAAIMKAAQASVVAAAKKDDPRVVAFDLGIQTMGNDGSVPTGCDWHPNVADNERMANIIREQIRDHLGWKPL